MIVSLHLNLHRPDEVATLVRKLSSACNTFNLATAGLDRANVGYAFQKELTEAQHAANTIRATAETLNKLLHLVEETP